MLRLRTITAGLATVMALTVPGVAHAARCRVPETMRSGIPIVERISTTKVSCDVGRDVARGIISRYDAGRPISASLGAPQPTFAVRVVRAHWRGRFTCRGRYVEVSAEGDLAYELRCARRTGVVRVLLFS
jgi:hypothetical protein